MYVDRKRPNLLRVRMFHGGHFTFTAVYRVRNRRALHPGQPQRTIETVFDDYRPARGAPILVPYRELERDADTGDILTLSRTDWIEFGAPLSDSAIAKPPTCS